MRIQWRYLDLSYQHNIGLLDAKIGVPWSTHWIIRIVINSPVTITSQLSPLFVKKSTFTSRYIVHPNGGGAAKLVCESCGAEYPYVANPSACAFCSVMKESGFTIAFMHRTLEYRWSDWGWAVMHNGYYIGEEITDPIPALRPTKFTAKHKALDEARRRERQERLKFDTPLAMYSVEVVPYPLKPVQPLTPDPVIMASIFDRSPGVGARSKIATGDKQLNR
jgi:hypothetical protein